ncbi:MAG: diphthine synthase [Halobacteriaceae archaeon]
MLTFVGLGLHDERSVTLRGRSAIRDADRVFAEFYTSRLTGVDLEALEAAHDTEIEVRDRAGVERAPGPILDAATEGDVSFLTAGDTMVSTTHVDLRLRAADRGIETRLVHGPSAATAAAGLTGLQNYRFGPATTLPFPRAHGGDGVPDSVLSTLAANRERGLHTLVYLDIKAETDAYMLADEAAGLLAEAGVERLAVAVCRAGSEDPVVRAARLPTLREESFGPPLHLLVVPGELHPLEADALATFADAPDTLLPH